MAVIYRAPTRQEMKEIRKIIWSIDNKSLHNLLVACYVREGEPVDCLEDRDLNAFFEQVNSARKRFDVYLKKHHIDVCEIPFTKEEDVMRGLNSNLQYVESADTINALTRATEKNSLPKDMLGIRKVGSDYLTNAIGVDVIGDKYPLLSGFNYTSRENAQQAVDIINEKARQGFAVTDKAFTSISLVCEDKSFETRPVMFEIQMPKGTKGLITNNVAESEFITPPNTSIEILGAELYHPTSNKISNPNGTWFIRIKARIKDEE